MEKLTSPLLIQILTAHREKLNRKFRISRQRFLRLDSETIFRAIKRLVEPVVEKQKNHKKEDLSLMVLSLYEQILELCGKNLFTRPGMEEFLAGLLKRFSSLAVENPDHMISSFANAFLNLYETSPQKALRWSEKLFCLPLENPSFSMLQKCGTILAWICGLPIYRASALEILSGLDERFTQSLMNLPLDFFEKKPKDLWLSELSQNPWQNPLQEKASPGGICSVTAGAFRGFDGEFQIPPLVFETEKGIEASDGQNFYRLEADFFGTQFIRIREAGKTEARKNFWKLEKNQLRLNEKPVSFPEKFPEPITSFAALKTTCCLTSALSHKIFIMGSQETFQ